MTRIVATWPNGETLIWTDGVLTAGPYGRNTKQLAFEVLAEGDDEVKASPEGPWVKMGDYPSNPYAFLGGLDAMAEVLFYPEATVVIEGELPLLGPGGVMPPQIEE
jgi:hypothetical protein